MSPHPQDSAARSPEGSTLCSAAAVNYNDSGSHKKCPAPTPHALEPPRPCVYITVLWHRRCERVCASSPPPPSLSEYILRPPVRCIVAFSSQGFEIFPLCTQISFQVCLPATPPPPSLWDLISLGQTVRICLGFFLLKLLVLFPALDQTMLMLQDLVCPTRWFSFLCYLYKK